MCGFGVGLGEEVAARVGWVEDGNLGGRDIFDRFLELESWRWSKYLKVTSPLGRDGPAFFDCIEVSSLFSRIAMNIQVRLGLICVICVVNDRVAVFCNLVCRNMGFQQLNGRNEWVVGAMVFGWRGEVWSLTFLRFS